MAKATKNTTVTKAEIAQFVTKLKTASNTKDIVDAYAADINDMCDVLTLLDTAGSISGLRTPVRKLCGILDIELAKSEGKVAGNLWWDKELVLDFIRTKAIGEENKLTVVAIWNHIKRENQLTEEGLDSRLFGELVAGAAKTANVNGIKATGKGRGKGYFV